MRIAVLSDVHGNALALEAVLDDIRSAAPDGIVNLGDCVTGPFDPARAADLQMALEAVTIRGNHDRAVLEEPPPGLSGFVRPRLSRPHLDWLAGLPATARFADVLACHGSPTGGDTDNLLDAAAGDRTVLADEAATASKLGEVGDARLILCGHTHNPRAAQIGPVLVLNPGSVGLPAFRLTEPRALVMEAGTPHARYALATCRGGTWSFEMRAVAYDWTAAAAQATAHGFPGIAAWTLRGRV